MSFGGRIKRGPMAADVFEQQFTQIYNGLFRDTRLSFKAKGIFGLISTHRDGFGISLESIAACSTDGIAGVRTGLQELIKYQYLQRDRTRDDLGRLGDSVYFITDMPDGLIILMNPEWDVPEVETGRSEPTCDSPTLAEPTEGNRSHKKTTSKNTSSKKTLSPPRLPQPRSEQPPAAPNDERETIAARPQATPTTAAQRTVRAAGVVAEADESAFIAWLTAKCQPRTPGWWRAAAADLPEHAETWRAERGAGPVARLAGRQLPPVCERCEADYPAARFNANLRFHDDAPCPACHPDAVPAAA